MCGIKEIKTIFEPCFSFLTVIAGEDRNIQEGKPYVGRFRIADHTKQDQRQGVIQKLLFSILGKNGGKRKQDTGQAIIDGQAIHGFGVDVMTERAKADGNKDRAKNQKRRKSDLQRIFALQGLFPMQIGKADQNRERKREQDIEIKGADIAVYRLFRDVYGLAGNAEKKDLQKISQLI